MRVSCLFCAALVFGQGGASGPEPVFYGDQASVNALTFDAGRLLAATKGGLVVFSKHGKRIERLAFGWNGLLDGRSLDDLWIRDGHIFSSNGETTCRWSSGRFVPDALPIRHFEPITTSPSGFVVPERPTWPDTGLPPPDPANRGTHVSAVVGDTSSLIVAWYGDGLWQLDPNGWKRLPAVGADELRHVKCMARSGDDLAVAGYDGSIWWRSAGKWTLLPTSRGPHGSVYALTQFGGKTVASTFENGVAWFDGKGWKSIHAPTLSTENPRELVSFKGALFVRQSTGQVDKFDGSTWSRNVLGWLPRGQTTCVATGDGKLLVGEFGGWSEFDGKSWIHNLKVPELQGLVVTALAGWPGSVWIGTQGKGVFRFDRKTGGIESFDQRQGLGDDWVRRIQIDGRGVVLGMFLTGAYARRGEPFARLTPEITGEATGLARNPRTGHMFVSSRDGLWRIDGLAAIRVSVAGLEHLEIQAVHASQGALWLGLPNGVAAVPWSSIDR